MKNTKNIYVSEIIEVNRHTGLQIAQMSDGTIQEGQTIAAAVLDNSRFKPNQKNNFNILTRSAIPLLREGIDTGNEKKILAAFEMVLCSSFSWHGLETPKLEWDELIFEANKILSIPKISHTGEH